MPKSCGSRSPPPPVTSRMFSLVPPGALSHHYETLTSLPSPFRLQPGVSTSRYQMNAARKLPDWDRSLSLSDTATSAAGQLVHRVMLEAAEAANLQVLDQLMRFHGSSLVKSLLEVTQSSQAQLRADKRSLEARLQEKGVRQNILDNLELSRLHSRRGLLLFESTCNAVRQHEGASKEVETRLQQCEQSQWEHFFGLTFFSFIAAGIISEDAPGVDVMLGWMRHSSRQVYVHAAAADEALRAAA